MGELDGSIYQFSGLVFDSHFLLLLLHKLHFECLTEALIEDLYRIYSQTQAQNQPKTLLSSVLEHPLYTYTTTLK